MRRFIPPLLIAIAACACSSKSDSTSLDTYAAENAKDQAQRTVAALLRDDFRTVALYTYPKVVEMAGGPEQMVATLAKGKKAMAEAGISFADVKLGDPSTPTSYGGKTFSVVPQTVTMATPKGEMTNDSYLLGISDDAGKTWTFVDGSGINDQAIRQVLPPLPSTLKLPAKTPPRTGR